MKINNLKLTDFRNFTYLDIDFEKGINLLVGKNGSGKTNIVESINYLMFAKSFRRSEDKDLIKFNKEFSKIEIELNKKEKINLEAVIYKNGKSISYNDIDLKKISELSGKLVVVVFTPEDVMFFKDTPLIRRRFLDTNISSMNNHYLKDISIYKELLKQRNSLLKEELVDYIHLDIITDQMIDIGYRIMLERKNLIKEINDIIQDKYYLLDDDQSKLEVKYITQVDEIDYQKYKKVILEKYKNEIELDIKRKSTSIGIHHDDIKMYRNEREIQEFGSQGQNRLAVLSLKFALVDLIKKVNQDEPILILDDVLSELDKIHQEKLISIIKDNEQVFITCADENYQIKNSTTYVVSNNLVNRR